MGKKIGSNFGASVCFAEIADISVSFGRVTGAVLVGSKADLFSKPGTRSKEEFPNDGQRCLRPLSSNLGGRIHS